VTELCEAGPAAARRGRPRSTSCRELRLIALRLFGEQGFENTTIEQIAAEAGVSERTFFRYFATKASVLWTQFDTKVETIRAMLAAVPDDMPMMEAIRGAVVAVNHYHAEDVPEMRQRMNLIATVSAPVPEVPPGEILVAPQAVEAVPHPHCRRAGRVTGPRHPSGQLRDLGTGTGTD
jgi:AcrR family transcriptional regulator